MLDLFNNGCGDVHSLVAKMSYPDIIGDCPVEEIKKKYHEQRQDAKSIEFSINYGGDANTIASNKGIPIQEAQKIYNNYMKGFKGMKTYQDSQRKFVMDNGYILLNPLSFHKAYIYDYDILMGIKKRFTSDFWDSYRIYKGQETILPKAVQQEICRKFSEGIPNQSLSGIYSYKVKKANKEEFKEVYVTIADTYIYPVKYFFKRKSASEKQAINYPCQASGAVMFKTASIFLWRYLLEHDLLFKVKLCVPAHDEWNIEVPEEIAEEMTKVLQDCMSRAGNFFCRKLSMPADAVCSTHWIH